MNLVYKTGLCAGLSFLVSTAASAQHDHHDHSHHENHGAAMHGNIHAGHHHHSSEPIGVMGAHMHEKGDWMLSYRYMHMNMEGNRSGTDDISATEIVTTVPNRFGMPATLRVVPTEMTMDMHMIGGMFAPTDWLTLMAMGMWVNKEMDHTTFQGMAGTNVLGTFETKTSGWGDTRLSGLIKLYDDETHHVHLNAGLSLPTGSIDEEDDVLAPTGMRPTLRLPYAMQLGTGTFDALPGITYTGRKNLFNWGAQYMGEIRLEDENDEGYAWGDKHQITAWTGYQWAPWINSSLRITGTTQDSIDGIDPLIAAPVQTADPDNYGGETISLSAGLNLTPDTHYLDGHTIAAEITVPVYQDLNGPQMETDWVATFGWSYRF